MAKEIIPVTPAIRFLKAHNVEFESYFYKYEDKGGTRNTSVQLKVDEHQIIKTLVFEDDTSKCLIVLMHGDKECSTKELARIIGEKSVRPATPQKATKVTGYIFGGTSPFGTRTKLDTYVESSILELDKIYLNGGKQGFIISIKPDVVTKLLDAQAINIAIDK